MTGSASNLTVLRHDELKNVNHGVLVEGSGTQILFHWTGLRNICPETCDSNTTLYVNYLMRYQGGICPPPPKKNLCILVKDIGQPG